MTEKIFETESLSMMPYLYRNGLKYKGMRAERIEDRVRVMATFEDPRGIGHDLAMAWTNSQDKSYRDWWTFFRNEIDRTIKEFNHVSTTL